MNGKTLPTLTRGRTLAALVVALFLGAWPCAARADDEAVARFERGVQLYKAENFEGALVEFNTAYKLSKNYKLLYNIGICQTELKDYAGATETFQRYLAEGGAEVAEERRTDVQDRIAKLALNITRVRVTTDAPAGSSLTVDDKPVGSTPLPETITVKIGRRQFAITANGRTVSKSVDIGSGDQNPPISLLFSSLPPEPLTPTPPPPTTTPPPSSTGPVDAGPTGPSFPYLWWGLTAGLGAVTAVTGIVAVGKRNDFEQQQATFGVTKATLDDARSSTKTMGLVSDIFLVTTVVSAGVSTWFTIDWAKKRKQANTGFFVLPMGVGYARSF